MSVPMMPLNPNGAIDTAADLIKHFTKSEQKSMAVELAKLFREIRKCNEDYGHALRKGDKKKAAGYKAEAELHQTQYNEAMKLFRELSS